MKGNNILSSLSYISIFFAPILVPIIIYFVAEEEVKYHAKKALWTHLIPCVTVIIGLAISGVVGFSTLSENAIGIALLIGTFAIAFILSIYYFIWNIVKGIKVLKEA
ncbi:MULTISPECIES: DUF4870 domain-containing protein [Bacillus]|uniref:DUF4870 domain-containing protein n=1 Tax=Bacillus TaxID=1386 RepID=UPI0001A1970C|nr:MULTISPECIES: DUF4870 domain-containing protein [Bacillus]AIK38460.1 tic20-like family protein [Bacillus pseudomycoides]AJI15963.1 tic20-like family protein [Bacillus pseudomycoides]EEM13808.1 hypothetical protein bpmyx0001_53470 [Bacillus pseudomycoides DSM 12442]MCX2826099.1 DUF4870 domain-containing protein [Bacillus sp. DHT2]MDR4913785.1 DUF4870 domain-containing protein [Bacillus pseudomycoides]